MDEMEMPVQARALQDRLKAIWKRLPRYVEVVLLAVVASAVSGYVSYKLTSQDVQPDITRIFGMTIHEFEQYAPSWKSLIALAATTPANFSDKAQRVLRETTPAQAETITALAAFVIGHQILFRPHKGPQNEPLPGVYTYQLMELESLGLLSGGGAALSLDLATLVQGNSRMGLDAQNLMMVLKNTGGVTRWTFPVTKLTEVGQEIFDHLNVPIDIDHVSWLLSSLENEGWETQLWAKWEKTEPDVPGAETWSFKTRYRVDLSHP